MASKASTSTDCQQCPRLEAVTQRRGGWESNELTSNGLCSLLSQDVKDPSIILVFAQADKIRECPQCLQVLQRKLKIPEFWWASWCKRSNGYFGCEDTFDEEGNFEGQRQKDYLWYKLNVFTRWIASNNQNIIVVFDPKSAVKERLPSPLLDSAEGIGLRDPYWIHSLFAQEVVRLQDEAVWGIRNLVRQTEIERTSSKAPNPNYPRLHDIARHAIHVSETLELAVETFKSIIEHHEELIVDRPPLDEKMKHTQRKIRNDMRFYSHMASSLSSRSTSNKQRLLNEIQLTFNTVAQYDSRISVEIGQAAQKDSSAMKTISFLTLTFFPATFISAIFSMSFFNYNPDTDEWKVSGQFWVYWAVAIPITTITAALWLLWHKFYQPRRVGEEGQQLRGAPLAKREMKDLATRLGYSHEDHNSLVKV